MVSSSSPSRSSSTPISVFVGTADNYDEMFTSGVVPSLLNASIGFLILQYDAQLSTYYSQDGNNLVKEFASQYETGGAGIQETSESSGTSMGSVNLTNTTSETIYVPAQGTLFTATDGSVYQTIEQPTNAAWTNRDSQTGSGYYEVAPGATVSVAVKATFEEDDPNSDAAGSIAGSSIAGITVSQPSPLDAGGNFTAQQGSGSTWYSNTFGDYTTVFTNQGLAPSEAYVNVDSHNSWTPVDVAYYHGYVASARAYGILSAAPLESASITYEDTTQAFGTSAWYAGLREGALYGAGLTLEQPAYYWFSQNSIEQQTVIEQIRWAESNGIRSTLLISENTDFQGDADPNFSQDLIRMLSVLKNEDALPNQIIIDNECLDGSNGDYFDSDPSDVNSLNAAAIEASQEFTFPISNAQAGQEVEGTLSAQTTLVMTQVDPSVDVAIGSEASFSPYPSANVYSEDPSKTLTLAVTDTTGLLALSDVDTGQSVEAGGTLTFTGTGAQAATFLQDLTASSSPNTVAVSHLQLTLTDYKNNVITGETSVYLGDIHPTFTTIIEIAEASSGPLGETLVFTLSTSARVTVNTVAATYDDGGVPSLLLTNGAYAAYQGQNSAGQLVFTFTPGANDRVGQLRVRGMRLNGSTIVDSASGLALDPDSLDIPEVAMVTNTILTPVPTLVTSKSNCGTTLLSGNGVVGDTVDVTNAGTQIASTIVGINGEWSLSVPLGVGSTSLLLTQKDPTGAVSKAASAIATVLAAPTVSSDNTLILGSSGSISGGGKAGDLVTISDTAGDVGNAVVADNGIWTARLSMIPGETPVTITLSDGNGDIATASATVSVLSEAGNVMAAPSAFASMQKVFATPSTQIYSQTNNSLLVVNNNLGLVDVAGATGSSAVVVGDGSTLKYSGSGDATIMAGDGNDTVISGAGNDSIDLGAGNNDIILGAGNSLVMSAGTDSIVAGSGADTIDISGNGTSVFGGYGTSGFTGNSLQVNDNGTDSIVFAATRGSVVHGSDTTGTTVVAFGDTTVFGGAKGNRLYAGNGAAISLTSNADGNILVANDGRWANGNYVTLDGSAATGGNQFWAGSGNATLIGGAGSDTMVAGSGFVTITGGAGKANDFDFFDVPGATGGTATITDFSAAAGNMIVLFGYGTAGVESALDSARQVGSSTVFSLGDGTTILLENFQKSSVNAGIFTSTTT